MVRVVRHSKIRVACIAGILRDFFTARREQASRATDIFRFIARESTRRRFTRNASYSLSPGGISLAIACAMSFLAICISMYLFLRFEESQVGNIALQYFRDSSCHPRDRLILYAMDADCKERERRENPLVSIA